MPQVVDLKPRQRKRTQRDMPLDQTSGASRFFRKMIADIESDLGGRRYLSRIEGELIRAFAGAATTLQYLNVQVALGDTGEIDLAGYATMASTMLRIGSRLGLARRARDVNASFGNLLSADYLQQEKQDRERNRQAREQFEQQPCVTPSISECD